MHILFTLFPGWLNFWLLMTLSGAVEAPTCTFLSGWSRLDHVDGVRVLSVASSPDEPRTLFIGAWTGAFRSDDCLTTAIQLPITSDMEVGATGIRPVPSVAVGKDGVVYAGGDLAGPALSHDNGTTWSPMTASSTHSLIASPDKAGRAYGLFFPQYIQGMRGLYRSIDAGRSWTPVVPGGAGTLVGADYDDDDTVYSIRDRSVVRINRDAMLFRERPVIVQFPGEVTAGSVRQGGQFIWAAVKDSGLYWSDDGGNHWGVASLPASNGEIVQLAPYLHDDRIVFAVTSDGNLWAYRRPDAAPAQLP